ncbi:hypothetical protein [Paludisphaera soli]|uniref:hypothetical protein n=1 Tax=Paludisphaera soli TaxID=2712865 RepID=UPI0013ECAF6E|nr:hypothetical protein [Paludisphaera soli]
MDTSRESLERVRDLVMLRLHVKRIPTRAIGIVMNVSHSTVVRRLNSIPPRIRERYEKSEVGGLL